MIISDIGSEMSLVDVLKSLAEEGYTHNISTSPGCCLKIGEDIYPFDETQVDKVFRFEGASDPGDQSIALAVTLEGRKGALVLGFGPTASPDDGEVLNRLALSRRS